MLKTVEIKTEGMSCMHCENTIKTEVGKLDGVKEVFADHKTNTAKVTYDTDKTDITVIEQEISEWGFKVISVN